MTNSPCQVANYFLEKSEREKTPISPMKLQKLMFFANILWLSTSDTPLIDEPFVDFESGMNCSSVYYEFRQYDTIPVHMRMFEAVPNKKDDVDIIASQISKLDYATISCLDIIWQTYKKSDAIDLAALLWEGRNYEKHPVKRIRALAAKEGIRRGMSIPTEFIKDFYGKWFK